MLSNIKAHKKKQWSQSFGITIKNSALSNIITSLKLNILYFFFTINIFSSFFASLKLNMYFQARNYFLNIMILEMSCWGS